MMEELIFIVNESEDGSFTARCLGYSIFTEAETIEALKQNIIDAIHCHFDDRQKRIVRMHMVKEEIFAV